MIRVVVLALFLIGCATDPGDPRERVSCTFPNGIPPLMTGFWQGECEQACVDWDPYATQSGPVCVTDSHGPVSSVTCHSFEWNGVSGCCEAAVGHVYFMECQP